MDAILKFLGICFALFIGFGIKTLFGKKGVDESVHKTVQTISDLAPDKLVDFISKLTKK